jgi:hypothetical protein
VRFDHQPAGEIQLVVDISIQQRSHFIVGHGDARCSARMIAAS